jgi:Ca2+-binding RTX toxin-like protein
MPGKLGNASRRRRAATFASVLAASAVALSVGLIASASTEKAHRIIGTPRPDHLVGTNHPDLVKGRGAGDHLNGRGGADTINGQGGFDHIRGGAGADTLLGGAGGAVMVGGPGRDEFNAIDGKLVGGQGRDVIRARDGHPDIVNCGPRKDVAYVDRVEDGVYNCERVVFPRSGQKRGGRR